ncbi:MAG: thioredoxin family protein [Saprospiraceae bacterium]|nr:thioredoxin family protein [Saprospiraceae bacterium]
MIRFSLLIICLIGTFSATAGQGPEHGMIAFETNAQQAFDRATAEGKHVFIVFKAEWCTPCRWMEATTFQDEAVIHEIETNYIPVAADIDQADGFVLFYDHSVQVLPTMLILDATGKSLVRVEESLGRDKLIDILKKTAKGLTPLATPSRGPTHRPTVSEPASHVVAAIPATPKKKDLGEMTPPPATGYSVQVGVYTLYPNVLTKALEINAIDRKPVHLEESDIDTVTVYKLLSGHFKTRAEAEAWRARLAEARIPGYIRDLARS